MKCPYCESVKFSGWGERRLRCEDCSRTFTPNKSKLGRPKGRNKKVCGGCGQEKILVTKNLCQTCYRRERRSQGKDRKGIDNKEI
jgi:DNA-directed RNA polymerase beta' subunit